MTIRELQITALILLAGLAAATIPAIAEETIDEDEQFTEAVRDFGYAGGAHGSALRRKPGAISSDRRWSRTNGLARLFGTDETFFFSTALVQIPGGD